MSRVLPVTDGQTATTMAGLVEIVQNDPELSTARRRNVACSIRRFCAALGMEPERTPAAFLYVRKKIERFCPADAGIRPHRWETIRSDVAFALRRIGLAPDQPKPRVPLSDAWNEVRARVERAGLNWKLTSFARYCSGQDIPPSAVTDEVIADHRAYLEIQTFKTKPQRRLREICRHWNHLAASAPELQLGEVSLPSGRKEITPPWTALHPDFRREAEAWLQSLTEEGDLLDETAPTRPLRPASIKAYRYALRQAVAGLQAKGWDLADIRSLAALVEPDAAEAALRFHLDRTGKKPSQMLAQIAHVLVLVAKHIHGATDPIVRTLKRYRSNLSPPRSKRKPRPTEALRQFKDPANIEKLLMLPERLYQRLRRKNALTQADVRLMQVAAALELLLMRPIRWGNLVCLCLGEHVQTIRNTIVIVLDGPEEVKNRVDHDYRIPDESKRLLDFYITRCLPLCGDNAGNHLFPGQVPGRPKSQEQFGRFFTKTIRAETGVHVYPHLLRHFGGTLYLTHNPGGLDIVRRVLGHRSAETTSRSYASVQDEAAVRLYDDVILAIRARIMAEIGDD